MSRQVESNVSPVGRQFGEQRDEGVAVIQPTVDHENWRSIPRTKLRGGVRVRTKYRTERGMRVKTGHLIHRQVKRLSWVYGRGFCLKSQITGRGSETLKLLRETKL